MENAHQPLPEPAVFPGAPNVAAVTERIQDMTHLHSRIDLLHHTLDNNRALRLQFWSEQCPEVYISRGVMRTLKLSIAFAS